MKRLLYLTHRVPYPPNRGDRIRTFHVLQVLARNAEVHLACLADEPPEDGALERLAELFAQVTVVRIGHWSRRAGAAASLLRGGTASAGAHHSRELLTALRAQASRTRFDSVLVSSSALVQYLRIPELDGVPAFVDLIDVDSQKWLDYARESTGPLCWLYRLEGQRLRDVEAGLPEFVRGLFVVSEAEAALYRAIRPDGPIHAIPNGVDLDYFRPADLRPGSGCVFVGALDYRPNVDGVCWFCEAVWPGIRRQLPDAVFRIVGRAPVRAVRALHGINGVEVVGSVVDVRPYLADAAVAVAPLRIARGVQNKVLEAMAMQKAVICSPQPLVGLGVEPGVHLVAAETPANWADAVVELLGDPSRRAELGVAARAWVCARHRWEACLAPLAELLELDQSRIEDPQLAGLRATL